MSCFKIDIIWNCLILIKLLLLDFSQLEWLFPDVNILTVKLNINVENGGKIMIIAGKTIKCKCGDCNFLRLYFYVLFMLLLIFICTIKISHDSDRKKQKPWFQDESKPMTYSTIFYLKLFLFERILKIIEYVMSFDFYFKSQ